MAVNAAASVSNTERFSNHVLSDREGQQQEPAMQVTPIQFALFGTLTAAVGWLVADKLAIGREGRFRRGHFRSFIMQQRSRIESLSLIEIGHASPAEFTREVKRLPELEKEFIAVEQHIRRWRRKRANTLLSEYRQTGYEIGQPEKCAATKAKLLMLLNELSQAAN